MGSLCLCVWPRVARCVPGAQEEEGVRPEDGETRATPRSLGSIGRGAGPRGVSSPRRSASEWVGVLRREPPLGALGPPRRARLSRAPGLFCRRRWPYGPDLGQGWGWSCARDNQGQEPGRGTARASSGWERREGVGRDEVEVHAGPYVTSGRLFAEAVLHPAPRASEEVNPCLLAAASPAWGQARGSTPLVGGVISPAHSYRLSPSLHPPRRCGPGPRSAL